MITQLVYEHHLPLDFVAVKDCKENFPNRSSNDISGLSPRVIPKGIQGGDSIVIILYVSKLYRQPNITPRLTSTLSFSRVMVHLVYQLDRIGTEQTGKPVCTRVRLYVEE